MKMTDEMNEEQVGDVDGREETAVTPAIIQRAHQPESPPEKPYKVAAVISYFSGCGRCSFFLSGYRAAFGEETVRQAVAEIDEDYLYLGWNGRLQDLVVRSYGVRVDVDYDHYEALCPECRRQFVYDAGDEETLPQFMIALRPYPVVD